MADATSPPDVPALSRKALRAGATRPGHTDRLVRETWRHYYVARLAEAQFGPDSLEASSAHSRALTSYRELRGSLCELDPYYRSPDQSTAPSQPLTRHLKLVRDEQPAYGAQIEP